MFQIQPHPLVFKHFLSQEQYSLLQEDYTPSTYQILSSNTYDFIPIHIDKFIKQLNSQIALGYGKWISQSNSNNKLIILKNWTQATYNYSNIDKNNQHLLQCSNPYPSHNHLSLPQFMFNENNDIKPYRASYLHIYIYHADYLRKIYPQLDINTNSHWLMTSIQTHMTDQEIPIQPNIIINHSLQSTLPINMSNYNKSLQYYQNMARIKPIYSTIKNLLNYIKYDINIPYDARWYHSLDSPQFMLDFYDELQLSPQWLALSSQQKKIF